MPQRGKLRVKVCVRAEARPESRPSRNGELALTASSSGSTGRSRSQARTARSTSRMPTWTCSEKVLLRRATYAARPRRRGGSARCRCSAAGGSRPRDGCPSSPARPHRAASANSRSRRSRWRAIASARSPPRRRSGSRSRGDQLAGDRVRERRVVRRAASRSSSKRCRGRASRVEDRELLLEADREVRRRLEDLGIDARDIEGSCQVEVERVQQVDRRARGMDRDLWAGPAAAPRSS